MAISFIEYNSTSTKVGDDLTVPLSTPSLDDLVIAFSGGFGGDVTTISIADSGGNTWKLGYFTIAFFTTKVWYAFANGTGAITITVTCPNGAATSAAAGVYSGVPPFAEPLLSIGPYVPSDVSDYPFGIGTGACSLADSFIVTVMCSNEVSSTTGVVETDTGDTVRNLGTPTDLLMWLFDREQAAADNFGGNATVMLKGGPEANSKFPLISLVFSAPLPETDPDRDFQYQVKPGSGETHYNPAAQGTSGPENIPETNRPLAISLAYTPKVIPIDSKKALISVGVMPSGEIDVNSVFVDDPYGNVYKRYIYSPGQDAAVAVAIFQTIISDPANLPTDGSAFQIVLHVDPQSSSDAVWQRTAIGVAERTITEIPNHVVAAGFKQCDDLDPTFRLVSNVIRGVPASSYIFAFAGYNAGGGQDSVSWTPLDGYVGTSYGFIQFPGAITNDPRLGPCIVMDKIAPSTGNYDAKAEGLIGGVFAVGGSIAMIAVSSQVALLPQYRRRRYL